MILQNNILLVDDIKKVGCLFLSLGRMAELEVGKELTPSQCNFVWNISRRKGYIDNNLNCKNPDGVIKEFAYILNHPTLTISQVGIEKDSKTLFWKWAEKAYTNYKYKVEKVLTPGVEGTHFRLCDKDNTLIYDSYSFKDYQHTKIEEYTLYTILQKAKINHV